MNSIKICGVGIARCALTPPNSFSSFLISLPQLYWNKCIPTTKKGGESDCFLAFNYLVFHRFMSMLSFLCAWFLVLTNNFTKLTQTGSKWQDDFGLFFSSISIFRLIFRYDELRSNVPYMYHVDREKVARKNWLVYLHLHWISWVEYCRVCVRGGWSKSSKTC